MSNRPQILESRLNALHDAHKSTLQLISRLSNLRFQPGSLPLNDPDGDVRGELTAEIHDSLKREDEELEILKQEVQELSHTDQGQPVPRQADEDKDQARLIIQVARVVEDFKM